MSLEETNANLATTTSPSLKWYEFYEVRTVGRALGSVLSVIGLTTLSSAFLTFRSLARTNKPATWILGLGSLILGIYMRKRKYWKDPVAVAEYRQCIINARLSKSLREFGWDGVLKRTCYCLQSKDFFF